jgi:lipoprotein-releasing system permease protein
MKEKGYNLRNFNIVGIFNSGFQEFDATFIMATFVTCSASTNGLRSNRCFWSFVDDFNAIESTGEQVYAQTASTLDSKTIIEKYSYIFEWLQLFDYVVILAVMILVATINMVVALLVLILERTQMIEF